MRTIEIKINEERNVRLTAYIQESGGEFLFSKRPAILVLPGGGYAMCSDREADPVASAYLKAGYQAFILRYSTGEHKKWPNPLEDYEAAMEYIKSHADEWCIDTEKIAAVGFSAGGHLCATAATMAKNKPSAAILVYPAILKDICDMCQPGMPQPNEHVSESTSPCFIVAARDDRTVDVKNALMMQLALAEKGVSFESHIYSFGGHGFSTGDDWIVTNSVSERVPNWVGDSIGWLSELFGKLTISGFTAPTVKPSVNADFAPILSVDCSLNHLRKQPGEAKEILAPLFAGMKAVADERGYSIEGLMTVVGNNTARELMEMVRVPKEVISEIDKALHSLINEIS